MPDKFNDLHDYCLWVLIAVVALIVIGAFLLPLLAEDAEQEEMFD